jgi:3-hydroxyisobutyrate dehydrogenase-like beta-hydroxyacid dehydrogenase
MATIAILHPGRMGAVVGRTLVEGGHDVCWLPADRGPATRRRAAEAGLREADDVRDCDVVLSICPPGAAVDVARGVGGYRGLFVDANAIGPGTARDVAAVVEAQGATYVDGGIVGPPPEQAGTTRLYLSGESAGDVARLFATSRLEPVVLPHGGTAASALKMSYAAWTKVTAALLVSIRDVARHHGVDDVLAAEWARSQPGLADRCAAALDAARDKGWRWEDEMREIARTFAAADQPPGFGDAAAEQFGRWPRPNGG